MTKQEQSKFLFLLNFVRITWTNGIRDVLEAYAILHWHRKNNLRRVIHINNFEQQRSRSVLWWFFSLMETWLCDEWILSQQILILKHLNHEVKQKYASLNLCFIYSFPLLSEGRGKYTIEPRSTCTFNYENWGHKKFLCAYYNLIPKY